MKTFKPDIKPFDELLERAISNTMYAVSDWRKDPELKELARMELEELLTGEGVNDSTAQLIDGFSRDARALLLIAQNAVNADVRSQAKAKAACCIPQNIRNAEDRNFDCQCKSCDTLLTWSQLYTFRWNGVNYPPNSNFHTDYESAICPECGTTLLRHISGQTNGFEVTEFASVFSVRPEKGTLWYNHETPFFSTVRDIAPELLDFRYRDGLNLAGIMAVANEPQKMNSGELSETRITQIVDAICSSSSPTVLSELHISSDEWMSFWSQEYANSLPDFGFVTYTRLKYILKDYEMLQDARLVTTFPRIVREILQKGEDASEIGKAFAKTALELNAEMVADKQLLPLAMNHSYDWIPRIHLLSCLAHMGIEQVLGEIDSWICPETNVDWVYLLLTEARGALRHSHETNETGGNWIDTVTEEFAVEGEYAVDKIDEFNSDIVESTAVGKDFARSFLVSKKRLTISLALLIFAAWFSAVFLLYYLVISAVSYLTFLIYMKLKNSEHQFVKITGATIGAILLAHMPFAMAPIQMSIGSSNVFVIWSQKNVVRSMPFNSDVLAQGLASTQEKVRVATIERIGLQKALEINSKNVDPSKCMNELYIFNRFVDARSSMGIEQLVIQGMKSKCEGSRERYFQYAVNSPNRYLNNVARRLSSTPLKTRTEP